MFVRSRRRALVGFSVCIALVSGVTVGASAAPIRLDLDASSTLAQNSVARVAREGLPDGVRGQVDIEVLNSRSRFGTNPPAPSFDTGLGTLVGAEIALDVAIPVTAFALIDSGSTGTASASVRATPTVFVVGLATGGPDGVLVRETLASTDIAVHCDTATAPPSDDAACMGRRSLTLLAETPFMWSFSGDALSAFLGGGLQIGVLMDLELLSGESGADSFRVGGFTNSVSSSGDSPRGTLTVSYIYEPHRSVPEPSGSVLVLTGMVMLWARKRQSLQKESITWHAYALRTGQNCKVRCCATAQRGISSVLTSAATAYNRRCGWKPKAAYRE